MIFAVPTLTPVMAPVVAFTVATEGLSEVHVTKRPVRAFPPASRGVAAACDVPTAVIDAGLSDTSTDATGIGVTVIPALPLTPSLVAVIVAEPGETAVTIPELLTVATDSLSEVHVIDRPVSALPLASRATAVARVV